MSGLPKGWDIKYDQQGRKFFVDHIHKKTTYQDPRNNQSYQPIKHVMVDDRDANAEVNFSNRVGSSGCFCFQTVSQGYLGFYERFGLFDRVLRPGANWIFYPIGTLAGTLSTRVQEHRTTLETKTKDNVFVEIDLAVQYQMDSSDSGAKLAFYKLTNPASQISSFIQDIVRSEVPKLDLDELFQSKEEIQQAVHLNLKDEMNGLGWIILRTLVRGINAAPDVKAAMNEIQTNARLRVANNEKAEEKKIFKVKEAEAEAESKTLSGKGVAAQRKALLHGLKESVVDFADEEEENLGAQEAMKILLTTQYLDTLKDMGEGSGQSTLILPHSPSAVTEMTNQVKEVFTETTRAPRKPLTEDQKRKIQERKQEKLREKEEKKKKKEEERKKQEEEEQIKLQKEAEEKERTFGIKPKVEVPKVEVPKVEVPKVEVPKVEVPKAKTESPKQQEDDEEPLPEGWEKSLYKGRPVYINHTTKTTTYDDPRKKGPEPPKDKTSESSSNDEN